MRDMAKIFRIVSLWLGLAYAAFLGLFALDAPFGTGLFIHLIPSMIIAVVAVLGFRNALAGGILAAAAAAGFAFFFHAFRESAVFLIVSAPAAAMSLLFFAAAYRGLAERSQTAGK